MPSFAEILAYGPNSLLLDQQREQNAARKKADEDERAQTIANVARLLEQQFNNKNDINFSDGGPVQSAPLTQADNLDLQLGFKDLKLNPQTLALADESQARTRGITQRNDAFEQGIANIDNPYAQVNAANEKSLNPVRVSSDTVFNQYDPENPIISSTPLGDSKISENVAAAQNDTIRNEALQQVLNDPTIHPAIAADIANDNTVAKSERFKVRRADGSVGFDTGTRNIDGTISVSPVSSSAGQAVNSPVTAGRRTRQEKSQNTLWQESVSDARKSLQTTNRFTVPSLPEVNALALDIFNQKTNPPSTVNQAPTSNAQSNPAPGDSASTGSVNQASPGIQPASNAAATYQHAQNAIAAGADKNAVNARLQAQGLDPLP